jgi:hypothetical protein
MADDDTSTYENYAALDLEKAREFRDDAVELHDDAEHLEMQADSVKALGRADEAARLRSQGDTIEAKADDLDRRADLLVDAAGMWREAGDDERRSADTRTRADAAFETAFDLQERINRTPMSDDEITEAKIEAARADAEVTALRERSNELAHQAGFDIKLAETEEAAAGYDRPDIPRPEPEPNPDLLPLE